ncbi:unnamed protein product [Leptosia nina]|uniref:Uncharacterized protein n=1 Tax=Leptosia nina TaxID=320188 RepID=A0AAV1K1R9_9NEOP
MADMWMAEELHSACVCCVGAGGYIVHHRVPGVEPRSLGQRTSVSAPNARAICALAHWNKRPFKFRNLADLTSSGEAASLVDLGRLKPMATKGGAGYNATKFGVSPPLHCLSMRTQLFLKGLLLLDRGEWANKTN